MLIGNVPLGMRRRIWILVFILLLSMGALYARNVRIYGYVVDSDNRGIELANVVSIQDAGLRTQDKRLNSADSETSETNVISPLSCVLHPLSNRSFPTISAALSAAFADASPEDLIFIGGSNYVVGTALQSPLLSSNPQSSEIFPTIPTSLQ